MKKKIHLFIKNLFRQRVTIIIDTLKATNTSVHGILSQKALESLKFALSLQSKKLEDYDIISYNYHFVYISINGNEDNEIERADKYVYKLIHKKYI